MNTFSEMNGSFQIQRLPSWLREMITMGQSGSLGSTFRNNFGSNFSSAQGSFQGQTEGFPFYRFGNWSSPSTSVSIRMQTSQPIQDSFGYSYNLGASYSNGGNYHFIKYQGGSDMMNDYQVIGSIPSRFKGRLGYFHAYGMTENYLIFCEQPCGFKMDMLDRSGFSWDCMEYMQGEVNYFYVLDKRSGRKMEMSYVTDKPYFFYNFVNCYESGNGLVIDTMGYEGQDFGANCMSPGFFQERYSSSRAMRFELPINGGFSHDDFGQTRRFTLRPQFMFPGSGISKPCINPNYNFRKYQYAYGMSGNSLMKFDTMHGRTQTWNGQSNEWRHFKTTFIANPSGRCEDDGVLVSCMLDSHSRRYMVFIDPRNMEEMYRYPFEGTLSFENHPFARFFY